MGLIIGFIFAIAVVGILFYVLVIYREVPGAVEQRLGVWEDLPQDVGKWVVDTESEEGKQAALRGQKREVRYWHDPNAGFSGRGKLLKQVRYRSGATNEILRVDPDEVIQRRRVKK